MIARNNNRLVHGELDTLLREGLLDETSHAQIALRYPVQPWDWHSLSRWFLIFGAVSLAAGVVVASRSLFDFTLEKLAIGLTALMLVLFVGARALVKRRPGFIWTPRALELAGGFTLIGLSFTLGTIYGSDSGNWPALLAVDLAILLGLSYGLRNPLLLTLSAVVFFCWFGGFTGYSSGWHMYWFGMSYPLRFLIASMVIVAAGLLHLHAERAWLAQHVGFAKIWISAGLFFGEMALWLLSVFGNFDMDEGWSRAEPSELVLFNLIWIALNVGLMVMGNRQTARMLTGYGATFLIIQIYTLFFAHLAESLGLFLSLFVSGGSALAGVLYFEAQRRGGGGVTSQAW